MASAMELALTPVDVVGLKTAIGPVDVVASGLRVPHEPDPDVPAHHTGPAAGTEHFIRGREIHHSTPTVSHCK